MIEVAENAPWEMNAVQIDKKGRYVILEGRWIKKEILLVGVYAPHTCQGQFWKELFDGILQTEVVDMIVLGNFNVKVSNSVERSSNSTPLELPKLFTGYMDLFWLVDIWRVRNPHKHDFTYFSHLSHSRIDYIMTSPEIAGKVKTVKIGEWLLSDHAFISIELCQKGIASSPWLW